MRARIRVKPTPYRLGLLTWLCGFFPRLLAGSLRLADGIGIVFGYDLIEHALRGDDWIVRLA